MQANESTEIDNLFCCNILDIEHNKIITLLTPKIYKTAKYSKQHHESILPSLAAIPQKSEVEIGCKFSHNIRLISPQFLGQAPPLGFFLRV